MSTFYGKYPPQGSGAGSGTVTEVDTGAGLNGGPITTTGTIALDVPVIIANGGTNSTTALNNNRVMQSSGGKIVEAAAITASRAVVSDANGIPVAATTTATEIGYVNGVTSAIQTQLNGKQATLTIGNLTDAGTDGITVTSGTGAVIGSGTSIAQHVADATHNGYLSSTDWSTFNGKQAALTIGNLTDAGTDGITVTGGTGAVIGSGTSLAQHVADATHNGYLSSTDWSTFNGKQASGNYITALTGDVTASGPGSVASTVAKIAGTTVSGTTGTTNVVFSTSPTLVTPVLGTPSSGTLTSCTGLPLTSGVTGVLPLANGGSNKNMTASNGAVVYSDADSFELSGVGVNGQALLSTGAGAPGFSWGNIKTVSSADYTITNTDGFDTVLVTTANVDRTITLPAAASNTSRVIRIKKVDSGSGHVIIDGNGSETIDGALTVTSRQQYDDYVVLCDGSNWFTVSRFLYPWPSYVILNTGAGHGSTNTRTRIFSATQDTGSGSAITYATSASNAASFTINEDGIYSMSWTDERTGSAGPETFGITLNSSSGATNITSLSASQVLQLTTQDTSSTTYLNVAVTAKLTVGDVIRPQDTGALDSTSNKARFVITQSTRL